MSESIMNESDSSFVRAPSDEKEPCESTSVPMSKEKKKSLARKLNQDISSNFLADFDPTKSRNLVHSLTKNIL